MIYALEVIGLIILLALSVVGTGALLISHAYGSAGREIARRGAKERAFIAFQYGYLTEEEYEEAGDQAGSS